MSDQADQTTIVDVARQIVAQLAPDELPLFTVNSQAYFENPGKALARSRGGSDDALGFGIEALGAAGQLLTPTVLHIMVAVAGYVVERKLPDVGRLLERRRDVKGQKTLASEATGATPRLLAEQLAEVRSVVLAKAHEIKLPDSEASMLADAVIDNLEP